MHNRRLSIALTAIAMLAVVAVADIRPAHVVGVGTRSFGMANMSVANVNDLSAIYWNPAALSFMPVRELQIAIDGVSQDVQSEFFGRASTDELTRLRLSMAGLSLAVPTSQGGLSFALGFVNPTIFDDLVKFGGSYLRSGDTIRTDKVQSVFGGLRQWGGAVGWQVAKGLGLGISLSLVTGRDQWDADLYGSQNGVEMPASTFSFASEARYVGYDARIGLLYNINDHLSIGARFVAPQVIRFWEKGTYYLYKTDIKDGSYTDQGQLSTSFTGAIGLAAKVPFATVSTELGFRAPYSLTYLNDFIDDSVKSSSTAQFTRLQGGIGAEVPLVVAPLQLRFGYSAGEFDAHPYAVQYDGESIDWSDAGIQATTLRNLLTAGIGYVAGVTNLEAAYGYQFWKLDTRGTLGQSFGLHRVVVSLGVRF